MSRSAAPRIAVLVRAHILSPKLIDLIDALRGHASFDTYVSANETHGPLDTGSCPRVPYTLDTMRDLGFIPQDEGFLINCSDLLFEHYRRCLPNYDFYILIEYDVELTRRGGAFFDDLARALTSQAWRDLDLTGTEVSYRGEGWSHHANAARLFREVYMVFFPVVVLSHRAIAHLYALRLAEGPRDMPTAARVFCEAFVASALVTDPRFRTADLNEIIANAYARRTFYWGHPMLFGAAEPYGPAVEMRHPVYAPRDFLNVHLYHASATGTLPQFIALVSSAIPSVDAEVRAEFLARAQTALQHHRYAAHLAASTEKGLPSSSACPPAILLTDDIDLPLREAALDRPAALTEVAGRSLAWIMVERLAAAGCPEVIACGNGEDGAAALHRPIGGMKIRWVDPIRPASGDRLKSAAAQLPRGRILVALGEHLTDLDVHALLRFHEASGRPATVAVARYASAVVALDGDMPSLLDRQPCRGQPWNYAGLFVFDPVVLDTIQTDETVVCDAFLDRLCAADMLSVYEHLGFSQGVGTRNEALVLAHLPVAYSGG